MAYTVRQLARLTGVSVRTLHHYDEIGLFAPTVIGANGYRYYDETSVLRLQSILFYRELDFPLAAIKAIVERPDFDVLAALREQRAALAAKRGRLHGLIATIDQTIAYLTHKKPMSTPQLFRHLTPEEERQYADEAAQRWDPKIVRASQKKYQAYSAAQKQQIADEGNALYRDLAAAIPAGPASTAAQAEVARWHRHMEYFWSPNDQQLLGLADLYNDDPRFRRNFDGVDSRLAPFMREAVKMYVEARKAAPAPAPVKSPRKSQRP
jgi:DNA-binding transcriptional MerR regulator